ncbi:ATP-binding protein [Planctomycetota bacterium]
MNRLVESNLNTWLKVTGRKPLVVRGARQVGKTWLIRKLASQHNMELIEFNFERDPTARRFFESNDPLDIIDDISVARNQTIIPEKSLLFLDEIQAAGDLLAKLRWFAEEMPQLAVVAAGSLLEFTLEEHDFSMPVGRIQYLHIEPMGFREFLMAHKQNKILQKFADWTVDQVFSPILHEQALLWFRRYLMVGGMPEVVQSDVTNRDDTLCRDMQLGLLATYRADFSKYSKRFPTHVLDATLRAVSRSLGRKFVYARVQEGVKQYQAKTALELLSLAKVCHLVQYSAANGLPLGGEIKKTFRKVIFNDIGLMHASLGSPGERRFAKWEQIAPQVRGQMAEQVVGQLLRLLGPLSGDGPQLYYWQREGGRPGEIDYLLQSQGRILPIELKSGATGSMKSLHQFMFDKNLDVALRFDQNPPTRFDVSVKTTQGNPVSYRLYSFPWYYVEFCDWERLESP